jgi:hypothetical protein
VIALTSQQCERLLGAHFFVALSTCAAQFLFLHPYFSTGLLVSHWLFVRYLWVLLGNVAPWFNFKKSLFILKLFAASFVGQLLYWSTGIIPMFLMAGIHAVLIPSLDKLWSSAIEKKFVETMPLVIRDWAVRIRNLRDNEPFKECYFQFFFVFYLLRLIYVFYVRLAM